MDKPDKNKIPQTLEIDFLEEEETAYDIVIPWKNSHSGYQFFQWIRQRFEEFEEGKQNDRNIFFFSNESTFAFRINIDNLDIHPTLVWNYWKDQIKMSGYILKNSEKIKRDKLSTFRYYLKPRLKYKLEKQQLFGNITLEFIKNTSVPAYIMFKCSWYKDQHYMDPIPFKELIPLLTN